MTDLDLVMKTNGQLASNMEVEKDITVVVETKTDFDRPMKTKTDITIEIK